MASIPFLEALEQALTQLQPPALVYLVGAQGYLVDEAIQMLRASLLPNGSDLLNFSSYQAGEMEPSEIAAQAETLPMFARCRLIVVRNADEWKAADLDPLAHYLEQPNPQTCLCLTAGALDQRTRWAALCKKQGLVLRLDNLTEKQMPGFIRWEASKLQLSLGPGVVERILEHTGPQVETLHQILSQLSLYAGPRGTVTIKELSVLLPGSPQHEIFALIDALGRKDRAACLRELHGLLAAKEPALKILSLIARQVRLLLQAKAFGPARSKSEAAAAWGVPPFVVSKLFDQAKLFSAQELDALHEAVYQTDRTLKQSKVDDARWLELFTLQCCPA